ncbi:hypothetical protein HR11_08565 [Porphyromonas macacae]|uniref:polysaccharide deacetylase family protein n=1 Tax=Porphyromonas macacae TaxID=28115 RepID=UPI00052C8B2B|nr:polysaccharide deacetylase family protein [Porphyromonas macacae]KGN98575.1 hypothetical protein HR11_08565 [Porphyromonas macacae]
MINKKIKFRTLMFHDIYENKPDESGFKKPSSNTYKIQQKDFIWLINFLIHKIEGAGKNVYNLRLTFDDGGKSFLWIAKELKKKGLVGHFFFSTSYIGTEGFCSEKDILEIHKLGHIIGNHSHTHPERISALSSEKIIEEWVKSTNILEALIGEKISEASIPNGYCSEASFSILKHLGYKTIFTSTPTIKIKQYKGMKIIGRFSIRGGGKPIKSYKYLLNSFSPLGIKIYLRWIFLELIKKITGSKFNHIRKIITNY